MEPGEELKPRTKDRTRRENGGEDNQEGRRLCEKTKRENGKLKLKRLQVCRKPTKKKCSDNAKKRPVHLKKPEWENRSANKKQGTKKKGTNSLTGRSRLSAKTHRREQGDRIQKGRPQQRSTANRETFPPLRNRSGLLRIKKRRTRKEKTATGGQEKNGNSRSFWDSRGKKKGERPPTGSQTKSKNGEKAEKAGGGPVGKHSRGRMVFQSADKTT